MSGKIQVQRIENIDLIYNLGEQSLESAIDYLTELSKTFGKDAQIDIDQEYDSIIRVFIRYYNEETDAEYKDRLERDEHIRIKKLDNAAKKIVNAARKAKQAETARQMIEIEERKTLARLIDKYKDLL